jgi:forespore regulator of the sigma-K checkpoint
MNIRKNRISRWFFYGFVCAMAIVILGLWFFPIHDETAQETKETAAVISQQKANIILKTVYVCGVEAEERREETISSTDRLLTKYADWELQTQTESSFVFVRQVNDLAPICKDNGYFGVNGDNFLTLFEGPPQEKKVIQTFFQIDVEKVESRLPSRELQLLRQGIRIKDIAEYHSILSTYGEFTAHYTPAE